MNILSVLRALARRQVRACDRPGRTPIRQPSLCRPRVDALEDRWVPSSIQMLPLGDGTFRLRIDGDLKLNQVSIVGEGPSAQTNDYSLVVTCDQLKQTVHGVSELVINTRGGNDVVLLTGHLAFHGDSPQSTPGIRSISVKSGDGDDAVKFIDFDGQADQLPGPHIVIDTGSGNDLAWFRPIFHPPTLFGGLDLSVRTGGGGDQVLIDNLAFAAPAATGSRVVIDTAGGDDIVSLNGWQGTTALDVGPVGGGGYLSVKTGAGRDTLSFADANFAGGVSPKMLVDLSSGDDTATFENNAFGGDVSLAITGDSGDDLAFFLCNEIAGSFDVSVDLGSGDDAAALMGNTIGGPAQLTVNGRAGNDRIEIGMDDEGDDYAEMMHENQFNGDLAMTITGDAGDDLAHFECNEIAGAFDASVDLGSGDDAAALMGNTIGGPAQLTVNGRAGNDRIEIGMDDEGDDYAEMMHENQFNGDLALTITGDAGDDLARFQCNEIAGSFDALVDLGKGDNIATIAENTTTGSLHMSIFGDAGKDLVTITCNGMGPTFVLVDLGDGRDSANVELTLADIEPSQKPVTVRVLGGKGDDDLALTAKGDPELLDAAQLLIDGGSGFDQGVAGPFVDVINCEK